MNKWIKIILVILTFAIISVALYLILQACNLTSLDKIKEAVTNSGKYGILVYIIIQIILLVIFCFVPLLNTTLIVLGIVLFGSKIAFISTLIAVFFSTTTLFFIGDKLGEKFAIKLIGEKDLHDAQNLIDHKSKFWLPVFFIIPGVPDEALCLVAGMTKMKYWYLLLVSMIYHAIEIGLFCFIGSGIVDWSALSLIDWFVLINILAFDIYLLFKLEKRLDIKKNNKETK